MMIEIKLMREADEGLVNTSYAPLAALWACYARKSMLEPLEMVETEMKTVRYSPTSKLRQVLLSILVGCKCLSEANIRLRPDRALAQVCQLKSFTDQSNLSRTLDGLTLKQIEQLREASTMIWRSVSYTLAHDWRAYLWLDFDLSGLLCGKGAEESTKGYFSGKKTPQVANWRV
jgi:hypothetical protein